ncbi:unnamed protein product [Soboliphyme baturini]|uniref:Uncharacterized protein n=1 Tax=Soboliphyme baturini TaxID=241478 RepID=A0A183J5Z5_9BILA|nr:unnamed protein product [Soboliphyme baturini]
MVCLVPGALYLAVTMLSDELLKRGGAMLLQDLFERYLNWPNIPLETREIIGENKPRFVSFLELFPWAFSTFPSRVFVSVRRRLPSIAYAQFLLENFGDAEGSRLFTAYDLPKRILQPQSSPRLCGYYPHVQSGCGYMTFYFLRYFRSVLIICFGRYVTYALLGCWFDNGPSCSPRSVGVVKPSENFFFPNDFSTSSLSSITHSIVPIMNRKVIPEPLKIPPQETNGAEPLFWKSYELGTESFVRNVLTAVSDSASCVNDDVFLRSDGITTDASCQTDSEVEISVCTKCRSSSQPSYRSISVQTGASDHEDHSTSSAADAKETTTLPSPLVPHSVCHQFVVPGHIN